MREEARHRRGRQEALRGLWKGSEKGSERAPRSSEQVQKVRKSVCVCPIKAKSVRNYAYLSDLMREEVTR